MHLTWYLNLEQCPEAEVIVKGEHRRVLARKLSPEEKKVIWPRLVQLYPQFFRNLSTTNASRDSVDEANVIRDLARTLR